MALTELAATLVLIVIGLWLTPEGRRFAPHHGGSDVVLYQMVIDDIRHGVPYYEAAAQEQRRHGYPMRPFVVVRPPLLAVTMAALPNDVTSPNPLRWLGPGDIFGYGLCGWSVWARKGWTWRWWYGSARDRDRRDPAHDRLPVP